MHMSQLVTNLHTIFCSCSKAFELKTNMVTDRIHQCLSHLFADLVLTQIENNAGYEMIH